VLFIGVVHNNDEEKIVSLRSNIEKLKYKLNSVGIGVLVLESSAQPPIKQHSRYIYFLRTLYYEVLGIQWKRYRKIRCCFIKEVVFLVFNIFKKLLNTYKNKNLLVFSEIEMFVTDKHLRLWFQAVEEADAILIFEDDVVFSEGSIEVFVDEYRKLDLKKNIYVDLAGGLDKEELLISHLVDEDHCSSRLVKYKKIVTNTACAYLLSRPLLDQYCSFVMAKPFYRYIGIDWLMNKLSISLVDNNSSDCLECFHFEPPVFQHGSFTGKFISWQKDK